MSIPDYFKDFYSYSRYDSTYKDDFKLSDEFICRLVDGNLICTDKQCTIGTDGNIVLVTPVGDVIHIGSMPTTEDGSKVGVSFDANDNLHLRYKVYLDNSHHHCNIEEEIIDTHLTQERKLFIIKKNLIKRLHSEIKSRSVGSIRSSLRIYLGNAGDIVLYVEYKVFGYHYSIKEEGCLKQSIILTDKGFMLLPDENGTDSIFRMVDGVKLESLLKSYNELIGLGGSTTFRLVKIEPNISTCYVLDTSDGVTEQHSNQAVLDYINMGIHILGVDILPDSRVMFRPVYKQ